MNFFQHTLFCTDIVRKSRIESCFARLESDMVRHCEIEGEKKQLYTKEEK